MREADPVGLTLSRFIHQREHAHPGARGELSSLLDAIGLAGRVIAASVRRAGLAQVLGLAGTTNVQGEDVKRLDVLANEALVATLAAGSHACILASEENEDVIEVEDGGRAGTYAVAFDPLDGSGNVDTAMPTGTIFSIHRRVTPAGSRASSSDLLQPGRDLVAAGYVLYGSCTMLVYACDDAVHGFTLDPLVGTWLSTHPDMRIPERGRTWSANPGNRAYWHESVRAHVAALESIDPAKQRPYGQRNVGALVADAHRTLLEGGLFMYPADTKDPKRPDGKLRLLYECAPLAFVMERAGGGATDGRQRILDIVPTALHQRTPVYLGSRLDVGDVTDAISSDNP